MEKNLITRTIEIVGLGKLAVVLSVSYQAIRKWERAGRLPRTEWTGETNYAGKMEELTGGEIAAEALLLWSKENYAGLAESGKGVEAAAYVGQQEAA